MQLGSSVGYGGSEDAVIELGRELEHCLKEIVLYKLDIKGYKKDLKKAHAQIEDLQAMSVQPPPTPDRDSASSLKSNSSSERQQDTPCERRTQNGASSGLGILLPQPPQTPTRNIAAATVTGPAAITPPVPSAPSMSSPSARPKAPLATHKKLPKRPASHSPSPLLPAQQTPASGTSKLHRGETLRSLSESIISSYAKRGTPEQGFSSGLTPPTRERSSDPLRTTGGTPLSRFAVGADDTVCNRF